MTDPLCSQKCDSLFIFQLNEPKNTFAAHGDKVSIVKFHPTAEVRLLIGIVVKTTIGISRIIFHFNCE